MYVRLTELDSDKKSMQKNIDFVNQHVIPSLDQNPASGFKGAYWLADRDAGKLLVFTLWDSENALRSNEEAMKEQERQHKGNGDALKQKDSSSYEVVATAGAIPAGAIR